MDMEERIPGYGDPGYIGDNGGGNKREGESGNPVESSGEGMGA